MLLYLDGLGGTLSLRVFGIVVLYLGGHWGEVDIYLVGYTAPVLVSSVGGCWAVLCVAGVGHCVCFVVVLCTVPGWSLGCSGLVFGRLYYT